MHHESDARTTTPIPTPPAIETQRTALVTGGTDGIGRAVAVGLADRGWRVCFVGRDAARGETVLAELRARAPGLAHAFMPTDLSSLDAVGRLADATLHGCPRLDAIVACAGVLTTAARMTDEGLEHAFVLNYLGRWLLVQRLLPRLLAAQSGRLVLVASAGKYADTLDLDDLQHRRGRPGLHVAGRTQFANDAFAIELAERTRGSRLEVTCVYPGRVDTSVMRNAEGLSPALKWIAGRIHRIGALSPEASAQTPVHLADSEEAIGSGGRFWGPRLRERPVPESLRARARRTALWAASEALVAERFGR